MKSKKVKLTGTFELFKYLKPNYFEIFILLLFSVIISLLSLLPAQILATIVNVLSNQKCSDFGNFFYSLCLQNTFLLITSLPLAEMLTYFLNSYYGYRVSIFGNRIVESLRIKCVKAALQSTVMNNYTKGDIISIISKDSEAVIRTIVGPMNGLVISVLTMFFSLFIFFLWNWKLALVNILFIPIMYKISNNISIIAKDIAIGEREGSGKFTNEIRVILDNQPLIRSFDSQDAEINRCFEISQKIEKLKRSSLFEFLKYWPKITFVQQAAVFISLLIAINLIGNEILASDIIILYMYLNNIYKPVLTLSRFANDIYQAEASLSRVFDIINLETTVQKPDKQMQKETLFSIEFNNLDIGYGNQCILKNFNLKAKQNELIAIIGESGSGKSTFLNIFSNNSKVLSGTIKLNNTTITQEICSQYVRISFSNPYILNRNLKDNLLYPEKRELTLEEFTLLDELGLNELYHKTIDVDNILEYSQDLSSGEKRRISLFRAIHLPANCYVIDEPTSELDELNRRKVINVLKNLNGLKIIATHDQDIIDIADQVKATKS